MLEASSDPQSLLGWAPIRKCSGRRQNRLRRLDLDCDRGWSLIEEIQRTGGGMRWPYHFFSASNAAAMLITHNTYDPSFKGQRVSYSTRHSNSANDSK